MSSNKLITIDHQSDDINEESCALFLTHFSSSWRNNNKLTKTEPTTRPITSNTPTSSPQSITKRNKRTNGNHCNSHHHFYGSISETSAILGVDIEEANKHTNSDYSTHSSSSSSSVTSSSIQRSRSSSFLSFEHLEEGSVGLEETTKSISLNRSTSYSSLPYYNHNNNNRKHSIDIIELIPPTAHMIHEDTMKSTTTTKKKKKNSTKLTKRKLQKTMYVNDNNDQRSSFGSFQIMSPSDDDDNSNNSSNNNNDCGNGESDNDIINDTQSLPQHSNIMKSLFESPYSILTRRQTEPTTITINKSNQTNSNETPLLFTHNQRSKSFNNVNIIENDINESNFEYTFLSTVDKIEDEFDRNAYEELIPLSIRMELENKVFGWSHLYSEFLGHVLFPLVYYLSMFWFVSVVGLRYVSDPNNDNRQGGCSSRCGWYCTFEKGSFHGDTSSESTTSICEYHFEPIFGISVRLFLIIRQILSIWSAFNAFRTVRRRRRVWLRHTAAEYFKNERTRDEMKEVDETTLLGKMRKKLRNRRDNRKILKAEKRFERRQRLRRGEFISSSSLSSYEGQHHKRFRKLAREEKGEGEGNDEFIDNDYFPSNHDGDTEIYRVHSTQDLDPNTFVNVYQKYKHASQEDFTQNSDERHFYARTMPTFAMKSINMDQIRLKSRIENVPYAHGGFFGAAPFMLANPHWIDILRELMPDVYVEISRRVVHAPVPQLIHWAENNPVVAAYGTAHELEFSGQVPTLEWDVFLDPHLVRRVDVVLQARDSFLKDLAKSSKRIDTLLKNNDMPFGCAEQIKVISVFLESSVPPRLDERRVLDFYNKEIDKRVDRLMENMLIAHGNLSQLFLEQTGLMKNYNFSRVKHTRRTLGGGIYAKNWIPTFVEALKMSTKSQNQFSQEVSSESSDSSVESISSNEQSPMRDKELFPLLRSDTLTTREEKMTFNEKGLSLISPPTIAESITTLKRITGCDAPLGLVLDVKSRHVPKRVWALLLDALRKAGTRVEGIATFFAEDIRDISKLCSVPVKEIIFYHSAGDLQYACHNGDIREGDSIFFNAGSLFWNNSDLSSFFGNFLVSFSADEVKRQYKMQPYARIRQHTNSEKTSNNSMMKETKFFEGQSSTIQEYKERFNLSIGLYVQEFIVDDEILEILINYVNRNQHIYNLGFSWGGINGLTVKGIQPGRLTNTDGLWNQRYIGHMWDPRSYPNDITLDTQLES